MPSRSRDLEKLFDSLLAVLIAACVGVRVAIAATSRKGDNKDVDDGKTGRSSAEMALLRRRYLLAFWLLKMADWLQGPYFFEVFASKTVRGEPMTEAGIARLFLAGFSISGLVGPAAGRLVDSYGRKAGTIACTVFSAMSAMSTRASSLPVLLAGRVAGGLGSSLLGSAPEAWLVAEHNHRGFSPDGLSDTFGLAYVGDAIAAILAGRLAGMAADRHGPTGPFMMSAVFLAGSALAVSTTWKENTARNQALETIGSIQEEIGLVRTWERMRADAQILRVGAVQAFFEGAMYIFAIQWPPALQAATSTNDVPFGKVFSCLMASCMFGTSVFAGLAPVLPVERVLAGALGLAVGAIGSAATRTRSLSAVLGGFLAFEACVGIYFPAIGTLRARYIPHDQQSSVVGLIKLPLNVFVASVMLGIKRLGLRGSLLSSATALLCALLAQLGLCAAEARKQLANT